MSRTTNKLSSSCPFVLVLGVRMLWRYFGAILFMILKVVIAWRSFLLSERVLHPSSDLRGRDRIPDGLPEMVHMVVL